jgi:hypothetical protein
MERTGSAVELLGDEVPVLRPVEPDQLPEPGVLGGAPVPTRREPGLPAAAALLLVVAGIAIAHAADRGGARVHGGRAGRQHAAAALGRRRGLVGCRVPHAQPQRQGRGRRRARHRYGAARPPVSRGGREELICFTKQLVRSLAFLSSEREREREREGDRERLAHGPEIEERRRRCRAIERAARLLAHSLSSVQ